MNASYGMDELLLEVCKLADTKKARVVIKESPKAGAICGASALSVTGALVMAPVGLAPLGLALGGIIGGITAFAFTRNKFKPLSVFIMEDLSKEDRQKLKEHMIKTVKQPYLQFFSTNKKMQKDVLKSVKEFFKKILKLKVVY
ncbi:protein Nazo [Drosophila takahashii]|uniref:protein Nazo n=1 Tax=Drosophila takahashii TaxID=29030 RepID=UPI00389927EB